MWTRWSAIYTWSRTPPNKVSKNRIIPSSSRIFFLFTQYSLSYFSLRFILELTLSLTYLFTDISFLFPIQFIDWMHTPHRYSVQEKILRNRNDEDRYSIRSTTKLNANEFYDPNQNKYYKVNGNIVTVKSAMSSSPMHHNGINGGGINIDSNGHHHHHHHNHIINNGNGNANNGNNGANNNGNVAVAPAAIIRERYQHPALLAIMNEAQGIKFRGKCALWLYGYAVANAARFISRTLNTTNCGVLVNRISYLHIGVAGVLYVRPLEHSTGSHPQWGRREIGEKVHFNYHIKSYFNLFVSIDLQCEITFRSFVAFLINSSLFLFFLISFFSSSFY